MSESRFLGSQLKYLDPCSENKHCAREWVAFRGVPPDHMADTLASTVLRARRCSESDQSFPMSQAANRSRAYPPITYLSPKQVSSSPNIQLGFRFSFATVRGAAERVLRNLHKYCRFSACCVLMRHGAELQRADSGSDYPGSSPGLPANFLSDSIGFTVPMPFRLVGRPGQQLVD